jgi:SAM-dependent methyltransferase
VCSATASSAVELPEYRLFRCASCGCWSSDALARGARTSFEPRGYFGNEEADLPKWEALLARLGGGGPGSVLDVGCGAGGFLAHVAARFPAARRAGIELDPARAGRARARDPGAEILAGDATEMVSHLGGRFDLVTLWDVFEHLPDPVACLRGLRRVLAPRGAIYLQTIHEESLLPRLGRLAYRLSGGRLAHPVRRTHEAHHLVFFTRAGLARSAERAGLSVRELWFDRLTRRRMDGPAIATAAAATLLALENALGGGLFVNALLGPRDRPEA